MVVVFSESPTTATQKAFGEDQVFQDCYPHMAARPEQRERSIELYL